MPGDTILSQDEFDPRNGIVVRELQEVFRRYAPMLGVHLRRDGEESPFVVRSTSEHPFYVSDAEHLGRWVAAGELQEGQWVLCDDGRWARVEEVADSGEWEVVYNMRVADSHTYFVGEAGRGYAVWVHNAYWYRGDVNHVPGSGPIGVPLDTSITQPDLASIAFAHVKQTREHADSVYTSWTTNRKKALAFAKNNINRVTKVSDKDISKLESDKAIIVYDATKVRDLIRDHHPDEKKAAKADDIKEAMDRNSEILIQGEVPSSVQKSTN